MIASRIPLFPLSMVLFPGQAASLHIFEQRYREMTRDCIASQSPFGIVFVEDDQPAQVGCSALIVKILKEYEDGRSDILTAGQNAFRVISTYEQKSYMEADVEFLEQEFGNVDARVSAEVEEFFNKCHRILCEEDGPRFQTEGGISLAYHIASELPVDLAFRQALLEERSEAERQNLMLARLKDWYPQLRTREHIRAKAAGNGHYKV